MDLCNKYFHKNNNVICHDIKWMQWILIGFSVLITIILLLIPLVFIFISAFSEGCKIAIMYLLHQDMMHATFLTLIIAFVAVFINTLFGVLMAWLIVRFDFFGKQLLWTILNIPIAISPVIAGLLYLLCYTYNGIVGYWLDLYNIQIIFTWYGIMLVTIFITCPFVVHELVPVMINQGAYEDEAAILLGASGWMMFRYVTLLNIRWALLHGMIITNARAIGEFGAASVVSGLIRGETYTAPLYIELLYQDYNTAGAFVAASLLAIISIIILCIKHYLQYRVGYVH